MPRILYVITLVLLVATTSILYAGQQSDTKKLRYQTERVNTLVKQNRRVLHKLEDSVKSITQLQQLELKSCQARHIYVKILRQAFLNDLQFARERNHPQRAKSDLRKLKGLELIDCKPIRTVIKLKRQKVKPLIFYRDRYHLIRIKVPVVKWRCCIIQTQTRTRTIVRTQTTTTTTPAQTHTVTTPRPDDGTTVTVTTTEEIPTATTPATAPSTPSTPSIPSTTVTTPGKTVTAPPTLPPPVRELKKCPPPQLHKKHCKPNRR